VKNTNTNTNTKAVAGVLDVVKLSVLWLGLYRPVDDREITMRLLKVTEEAGEAAQAWIGATGQNPRKGVTHSRADVAAELADVVVAALVAVASLDLDPAAVLAAKVTALRKRLDGCAAFGHDVAADGWRMCACGRSLPGHADTPPDPAGGEGCGMTWRVCAACEFIDEHHITEHDQHVHEQDQPGGYLRQDVSAGPALPNHQEATGENAMVEPYAVGGGRR
jgi:NTP pyrophosphatase (non-canonical NTP hydrolase)